MKNLNRIASAKFKNPEEIFGRTVVIREKLQEGGNGPWIAGEDQERPKEQTGTFG